MILYRELGWSTYEPHPDGAELFERIVEQHKLDEFEMLLENSEGEYVNEDVVDDLLRFEEGWLVEALDLEDEDEDEDEEDKEDDEDSE